MVAVLALSVQVENGLIDDCHFVIVPVCPVKVNIALVLPEHIVDPPVTVPPIEAALTFTVVTTEFATVQLPLCTTAINCVVAVKAPDV